MEVYKVLPNAVSPKIFLYMQNQFCNNSIIKLALPTIKMYEDHEMTKAKNQIHS
jgi:23S rRNA C2498 (ribose-2'-O)-methylase RlmM